VELVVERVAIDEVDAGETVFAFTVFFRSAKPVYIVIIANKKKRLERITVHSS
jgi:hypothetical protein